MLGGGIGPGFRGAGGLGHRAGPGGRARRQEGFGAADAFALLSWNRQAGSSWRQNSPIWLRSSCEGSTGSGKPRLPATFLPFLESLRRVRWHGRSNQLTTGHRRVARRRPWSIHRTDRNMIASTTIHATMTSADTAPAVILSFSFVV